MSDQDPIETPLREYMKANEPPPNLGTDAARHFRQQTTKQAPRWAAVLWSGPAMISYSILILAVLVLAGMGITQRLTSDTRVAVDRNALVSGEHGQLEGFVNYGSAITAPAQEGLVANEAQVPVFPTRDADPELMKNFSSALGKDAPPPGESAASAGERFMAQNQPLPDVGNKRQAEKSKEANRGNTEARDRSELESDGTAVTRSELANSDAATRQRKLITNVRVEFEVDSYQAAADAIELRVEQAGGYLAGQDVRRFPNGKLEGTLIARVPAAGLESFLAAVDGLGEILGKENDVQDITGQYVDTQARLRNAQRMEERLIELLQTDTNDVADLLKVEKELGRVRESIEQMQAQIKTWDTLVSFATVRFLIREKNLDEPAAFLLRESIEITLLTNTVETAYERIREIAAARSAEIARAILVDQSSDQVSAQLRLLIEPEQAADLEAALREVGSVRSYQSKIERTAKSGSGETGADRTETEKTVFEISLRSENQPVEQVRMVVRAEKVAEELEVLKLAAANSGAEIRQSNYQRASNDSQSATLVVRLPSPESETLIEQIRRVGKVETFTVSRNDQPALEGSPTEIAVSLTSLGKIITDENSIGAVLRRTFGQAIAAVGWSVRMIAVAIAFLAPWAAAGAVIWFVVRTIRRARS